MIINEEEYIYRIDGNIFHCALDVTMYFVGGKWKAVILWYLRNKTYRFGSLKRQIPDITEKMLSLQLKALVEDGLVSREQFEEVPKRVEYSLTEFGNSLIPMLNEIAKWGRNFAEKNGTLERKGD